MRRIPVLFLLAVAFVGALAAPGWAHTEMVQTSPTAGATETAELRAVTLAFTQTVDHRLATVTVRHADGSIVSSGQPQRDGQVLAQPVAGLSAGRYGVEWRAAAADGHILEGTFGFRVSAEATPSASAAAERLSPAELLREHARGNDDHDAAPSYAIGVEELPAGPTSAPVADAVSAVEQPVPPAPDNAATAIVVLLAAAAGVTAVAAAVEGVRAHRV